MTTSEILKTLNNLIPEPKCSLDYGSDYQLLIAVMLSAQSTDKRVNQVTKELFKYDIFELAKLDTDIIESIIASVGTQKRKAQYISQIANQLIKDYNGVVPHNREYVESLPGIGHKTCNVVFSEIFKEDAIAVDTHVSRVSKRLGFACDGDDVTIIEEKLKSIFPKKSWSRLHLQLVLFGRNICTSRNPKCEDCPFRYNQCKKPQI